MYVNQVMCWCKQFMSIKWCVDVNCVYQSSDVLFVCVNQVMCWCKLCVNQVMCWLFVSNKWCVLVQVLEPRCALASERASACVRACVYGIQVCITLCSKMAKILKKNSPVWSDSAHFTKCNISAIIKSIWTKRSSWMMTSLPEFSR